ncbi:hypothetical protein JW711_03265 [Candidatus Woesearchaeota archaeon]|nr:hypothetical protein [Candidatus Woesearchaeota archaeon]
MIGKTAKNKELKYKNDLEDIITGQEDFSEEEAKLLATQKKLESSQKKYDHYDRMSPNLYYTLNFLAGEAIIAGATYTIAKLSGASPADVLGATGFGSFLGIIANTVIVGVTSECKSWEKYLSRKKKQYNNIVEACQTKIEELEAMVRKMPDEIYMIRPDRLDEKVVSQIKKTIGQNDEVYFAYSGMDRGQVQIVRLLHKQFPGKHKYSASGIYSEENVVSTMRKLANDRKRQVGIMLIDNTVALSINIPEEEYGIRLVYNPSNDKWHKGELELNMPRSSIEEIDHAVYSSPAPLAPTTRAMSTADHAPVLRSRRKATA